MILTLADQPILTAKGNVICILLCIMIHWMVGELNEMEDALENAPRAEDARRRRAYLASKPQKDEAFDTFGDKKNLLSNKVVSQRQFAL